MTATGGRGEDLCLRRLLSCHRARTAYHQTTSNFLTQLWYNCVLQMLIEARQLRDAVLETRVQLAKTTNRLIQLDNPVLRTKLKELKRKADAVIAEHGM